MHTRIVLIEHENGTGPQRFGRWLQDAGAQTEVIRPYKGEKVPEPETFLKGGDGLIVLGGAASACEDAQNPWFRATKKLLVASAEGCFPSLNICLGGQMLAVATGGGIRKRPHPQYGVYTITPLASCEDDPVWSCLAPSTPVILYHGDEILLPQGAILLASGSDSPNQLFRIGRCAWGTQFHPESTGNQLATWFASNQDASVGSAEIVRAVKAHENEIETAMRPVAEAFVRYCREFREALVW